MKSIISILLCLMFCVISFAGGFSGYLSVKSKLKKAETPRQTVVYAAGKEEKKEAPKVLPQKIGYIVKVENSTLGIYELFSDQSVSLKDRYTCSINFLPREDRENLLKGIFCADIEEALSLAEDYSE